MRVHYKTFGCKTNQYDTERARQLLQTRAGATVSPDPESAAVCVVNTCTVTNRADADARRFVRRAARRNPDVRIVVTGCSAALQGDRYRAMDEVAAVVEGYDPAAVLRAVARPPLVQLGARLPLDRTHAEPVGADVLRRRAGATRGWLKVQATRLARGPSRSRDPAQVVQEARVLAARHPELVVTGVHIGHYGRDLNPRSSLSALVRRLLEEVPDPRFRLGSIEATEIDDALVELMAGSGGRLAPHFHMPLQSGSDPVLRKMRRWHTREDYRRRVHRIAQAVSPLGLGADVITGFPGETAADHARTRALVEELPFTYLHVFPWSPRDATVAADLPNRVPQRVSAERSRELRTLAEAKGARHARRRGGEETRVVLEGAAGKALTGDYLRVHVLAAEPPRPSALHRGRLTADGASVQVEGPAHPLDWSP